MEQVSSFLASANNNIVSNNTLGQVIIANNVVSSTKGLPVMSSSLVMPVIVNPLAQIKIEFVQSLSDKRRDSKGRFIKSLPLTVEQIEAQQVRISSCLKGSKIMVESLALSLSMTQLVSGYVSPLTGLMEALVKDTDKSAITVPVATDVKNVTKGKSMEEILESLSITRVVDAALDTEAGLVMLQCDPSEYKALGRTIFKVDGDGDYGLLWVNGKKIIVKLLEQNFTVAEVPGVGCRWIQRISGEQAVINNLIKRRHNLDAKAFMDDMAKAASSTIFNHLSKKQSTGLGYYGAPGQFGNVPDNTLAMDISKANVLVKKIVKKLSKSVQLGDLAQLVVGKSDLGWLLDGAKVLRMKREPDTAPNGSDLVTIMVVDAGYPTIGLNEQTMESLLGDFDFDTLMLSLSEAAEMESLEYVISKYTELANNKFQGMHTGRKIHFVNKISGNLSLQHVSASRWLDDEQGAYLRAVNAEDKKSIGLFKIFVFWTLGAIYRASVTKAELLAKANELATAQEGDDVVLKLHRGAIELALASFEADPSSKNAATLAFRVWKFEVHPFEEAIMDGNKREFSAKTENFQPAVKINVPEFMLGATATGRVDWAQLEEEGYKTDCLKLAIRSSFVTKQGEEGTYEAYDPKATIANLDPMYANLISKKGLWQGDLAEEGSDKRQAQISTLAKLLGTEESLSTMLGVNLRDVPGFRVDEDRITVQSGKAMIAPMFDFNRGEKDASIDTIVADDVEGFYYLAVENDDNDQPVLYVRANGKAKPYGAFTASMFNKNGVQGWQVPVGAYSIKQAKSGLTVIKNLGGALVNDELSNRFRVCGVHVGALELPSARIVNNDLVLTDSEIKAYDKQALMPLHLVKYNFVTKATMVANNQQRGLSGAADAVRSFINSLLLCDNKESMDFLGEFVTLDIPNVEVKNRGRKNELDLSKQVRRHMLATLQHRGYDLDSTSHATRGREVAKTREDGMTVSMPAIFGWLGNHVRLSKGFSTRVGNLPLAHSTLGNSRVTTVNTVFLNLDEFGPNPGDNTLRTVDGSKVLALSNLPMVEVTEEKFNNFCEENPELVEKAEIRSSTCAGFNTCTYWIPNEESFCDDGAFKLLIGGFVPGISQPIYDCNIGGLLPARLATAWTNDVTHVSNAKLVHVIMDERTAIKKGMSNGIMSAVAYQVPSFKATNGYQELVCKDRALMVAKANKGLCAYPEVGQFNDGVGRLEQCLVESGKPADGKQYLYGVASDGTLTPVLDQDGNHVRALAGPVEASRPKYVAEDSYGDVKKSTTVGIHDRLSTGQDLEWSDDDAIAFAVAKSNLKTAWELENNK